MTKVVTAQERRDSVPARWRAQYALRPPIKFPDGSVSHDVLALLDAMRAPISADDLVSAGVQSSWWALECDECGQGVESVVRFGRDGSQDLCGSCLTGLAAMLK